MEVNAFIHIKLSFPFLLNETFASFNILWIRWNKLMNCMFERNKTISFKYNWLINLHFSLNFPSIDLFYLYPAVCPEGFVRSGGECFKIAFLSAANFATAYEKCGADGAMPAMAVESLGRIEPLLGPLVREAVAGMADELLQLTAVEIITGINDL